MCSPFLDTFIPVSLCLFTLRSVCSSPSLPQRRFSIFDLSDATFVTSPVLHLLHHSCYSCCIACVATVATTVP